MKTKNFFIVLGIGAFVACLFLNPAVSQEMALSTATVMEIKGAVSFMKEGAAEWLPLEKGMVLGEGDKIKTGPDSEATIETAGTAKTALLTVRKGTEFTLKTLRHDASAQLDSTLLNLEIGSVLVKAEKLVGGSRFEVKTPTSIVGIRGTTFEVNVAQ